MKCPNCHLELTYNTNFCSNCGNRVISCSRCHNKIEKTDKFCKNCGFENKDLGQEEQCVDDDCSYGGDTWNPSKRDISNLWQEEPTVDDNCNTDIWYPPQADLSDQNSEEKPRKTEGYNATDTRNTLDLDRQEENEFSHTQVADTRKPLNADLSFEGKPSTAEGSKDHVTRNTFDKERHIETGVVATENMEDADMEEFEQQLTNHKHQRISLAIAGDTCVGKSSFINFLLNLKEGDENYAKTGDGDTTMEPKTYYHPRNTNFTISDMPGYGTRKMPMKRFVELANLSQFDYFLIFFNPVLREVDITMAKTLKEHKIPFALVRTKLDLYLQNKEDRDTRKEIETLRKQIYEDIKDDEQFGECKLFLISNESALFVKSDLTRLVRDIANKLTEDEYEAFLLQIEILVPEIIDIKYQELKKRIPGVAKSCAVTAATWVPFINVYYYFKQLVNELNLYVQTFGLDKDFVPTIPGLKSRFSSMKDKNVNWKALLGQEFSQIAQSALVVGVTEASYFVPVVGNTISGISTGYIVYTFLQKHLDELRSDALTVYQHLNRPA